MASGHEFWIEPEDFSVETGEPISARLYVGQELEGPEQPFIPNYFTRFEIIQQDRAAEVVSLIGNRPALVQLAPGDGLAVLINETVDHVLTYSEWQNFVDFVQHKDMPGVLDDHAARGLPQTGFAELYRRFAKSLVAVGDGQGADARIGLRTEIVAEANPYTDDVTGGVPVRVWFEDGPRADAQIELFERAPHGTVAITLHRTDAKGRAMLPVKPGHFYLVDAVKMVPLEAELETDPVWYSLWASLTFEVPGLVSE